MNVDTRHTSQGKPSRHGCLATWVDRGDGKDCLFLAIDSRLDYTDTVVMPPAGPERPREDTSKPTSAPANEAGLTASRSRDEE